jgi:ATP-dependent protease HslVU (ClpYQ) peptidase subunit
MSVIVAVTNGEKVWMGSDSAVTDSLTYLSGCKVHTVGEILYGVVGNLDSYNAIVHGAKLPGSIINARSGGDIRGEVEVTRWAYHTVLPRIKEAIARAEVKEPCFSILLGVRGRILMIDENCITEDTRPYASIGEGAEVALGALHSQMHRQGKRDHYRIAERSMLAAAEFINTCRGPFFVRSV